MAKITASELHRRMVDLDVDEKDLRPFFQLEVGEGGPFSPRLVPNPETVDIPDEVRRAEVGLGIANHYCRWRRRLKAEKRLERGEDAPLIVTEGDSWFQFPIFLDDVVDHLSERYIPWSLGAAGDTVANMVLGTPGRGRTEYLRELVRHRGRARAFVFSGAGNDVIGTEADGTPALLKMLRPKGHDGDPISHLDLEEVAAVMASLHDAYRQVIREIRRIPGLERLPVLIHGYDYAIPGPDDDRSPIWAQPWLSGPLDRMPVRDPDTRRGIVRVLINELYSMLIQVSRHHDHVYVVDVRDTLPTADLWADEIHPTDEGFARVARRFEAVLGHVVR